MSERKKEHKFIERNGKKIKLERYEGDTLWTTSKDKS